MWRSRRSTLVDAEFPPRCARVTRSRQCAVQPATQVVEHGWRPPSPHWKRPLDMAARSHPDRRFTPTWKWIPDCRSGAGRASRGRTWLPQPWPLSEPHRPGCLRQAAAMLAPRAMFACATLTKSGSTDWSMPDAPVVKSRVLAEGVRKTSGPSHPQLPTQTLAEVKYDLKSRPSSATIDVMDRHPSIVNAP